MSGRVAELLEALRVIGGIQRNGKTLVNNEIQDIMSELMRELRLRK